MPIEIQCQGCGRRGQVPDQAAGKRIKCPGCATVMVVPAYFEEIPDEPAYPPVIEDDDALAGDIPPRRPQKANAPPRAQARPAAAAAAGPSPRGQSAPDDRQAQMMAMLGIGVGVLILIGVVLIFSLRRSTTEQPPHPQTFVVGPGPMPTPPGYPGVGPVAVNANPVNSAPVIIPPVVAPPVVANEPAPDPTPTPETKTAPAPKSTNAAQGFGGGLVNNDPAPDPAPEPTPAPRPTPRPSRPPTPDTKPRSSGKSGTAKGNATGFGGGAGFGGGSGAGGAVAGDLQLKADPAREKITLKEGKNLRFPFPAKMGDGFTLFPSAPSGFLLTGHTWFDDQDHTVWDLSTGKSAGKLAAKVNLEQPMGLSPDGKFLAAFSSKPKKGVGVYSFEKKEVIAAVLDDEHPAYVDFSGSDKLVIVYNERRAIEVWDYANDKKLRTVTMSGKLQPISIAVSPGQRYLAYMCENKVKLEVADLQTGEIAGTQDIPNEGPFGPECFGMAFSSDGTMLAAVFKIAMDGAAVIRAWKLSDGEMIHEHRYTAKDIPGRSPFTKLPGLSWLPDGSGWLVYNQAIIERNSGQKVESLPFENDRFPEGPRRVLDGTRVLTLAESNRQREMRVVPLNSPNLQAAMDIAKAGGDALDAKLPKLTDAVIAQAKKVSFQPSASWGVKSDPAPTGQLLARGVPLEGKAEEVESIHFTPIGVGQAVVNSAIGRPFGARDSTQARARRLERIDLRRGAKLAKVEIPPVADLGGISPDGEQMVMIGGGKHTRVDVIKFPKADHVVGWRPYGHEEGEGKSVIWADYLDAGRILTVNTQGTLILWTVPDCKAVYIAEGACPGAPRWSPNRNYLAAWGDGTLRILDPRTGQCQGVGSLSPPQGNVDASACAFRQDGGEIAVALNGTITRLEMATGKVVETINSPQSKVEQLQFCGNYFLLINNSVLYDFVKRRGIWNYAGFAAHTPNSPNGAHWLATSALGSPLSLQGLTLPTDKTIQALKMSNDPNIPAAMKPGARITVEVQGAAPRNGDQLRNEIIDSLTKKLAVEGVTVAPNQPVRLVIALNERSTGDNMQLMSMGFNFRNSGKATANIALRELDCDMKLFDGQGEPIVIVPKMTFGMRTFGIVHMPADADPEQYLHDQLWNQGKNWAMGFAPPAFIARSANGVITVPGFTNFNVP